MMAGGGGGGRSSLRQQLLLYREQFRRLDRKWHWLIGSQLLFGMFVIRMKLYGPSLPSSPSTGGGSIGRVGGQGQEIQQHRRPPIINEQVAAEKQQLQHHQQGDNRRPSSQPPQ